MASSFNDYKYVTGNVLSKLDTSRPLFPDREDKALVGKDLVYLYEAIARRRWTNGYKTTKRSFDTNGSPRWDVDISYSSDKPIDVDDYLTHSASSKSAQLKGSFIDQIKSVATSIWSDIVISCIDQVNSTQIYDTTIVDRYGKAPNSMLSILNAAKFDKNSLSSYNITTSRSPLSLSSIELLYDVTKYNTCYMYCNNVTSPTEHWKVTNNQISAIKAAKYPIDLTCDAGGTLSVINGMSNPKIGFYARYDSKTKAYGAIDTSYIGGENFSLCKFTLRDHITVRQAFLYVHISYAANLNSAGNQYSYAYAIVPTNANLEGTDSYGHPVYNVTAPSLQGLYAQAGFDELKTSGWSKDSTLTVIYTPQFVFLIGDINDVDA